jgi:hypothetical protein
MAFSPVPESVQNVVIRPLDKGIHLEVASQGVPDGGFVNVENMLGGLEGPRKRPGYVTFAQGIAAKYNPTDFVTLWNTAGSQISILITEKTLYLVNPLTGMTEVAWAYSTGTVGISSTTITGNGTLWLSNDIMAGDVLRVGTEEGIVSTIDSNTQITLVSATITNASNKAYSIQRTFAGGRNAQVDWAIFEGKLLLADGKRPLMKYDPATGLISYWTTLASKKILATLTNMYSTGTCSVTGTAVVGSGTSWAANALAGDTFKVGIYEDTIAVVGSNTSITLSHSGVIPTQAAGTSYAVWRKVGIDCIPCSVAVVNDPTTGLNRVWIGRTYDATDGDKRQRIRWSSLADTTDFSIATNYLDLPYVNGALKRLVQFGTTLAAYFDDAVFMGQQTNYPLLPLDFRRIETGGIGLIGAKAVTPYIGGHFFVGQDDIYFLAYGQSFPERIGTPIIREALSNCSTYTNVYATIDPINYRIVFGFPILGSKIEMLYSFDYRAKCWTKEPISTTMIANPLVQTSVTWDSLTGTWDALTGTWDTLTFSAQNRALYVEYNKAIYQLSTNATVDYGSSVIQYKLETKDHDFGMPDDTKVVTRFSMKINSQTAAILPIDFFIQTSVNRGISWKTVGSLRIPVGQDEGSVDFRSSGSTFRIRATGTSAVTPFEITEYGLRVRRSGSELAFGTQK